MSYKVTPLHKLQNFHEPRIDTSFNPFNQVTHLTLMHDLRFAFRQLLKNSNFTLLTVLIWQGQAAAPLSKAGLRGTATAEIRRPATFPHRIWAACDFEGRTPDYGWFGLPDTNNVPRYPGNRTALRAGERPYQAVSAVMAGINPVPGPRMGKANGLFLRYFLTGGTQATFQHFSLTHEDNWHIVVDGLAQGRWDEVTLNFTRDARRNDGGPDPFGDGE